MNKQWIILSIKQDKIIESAHYYILVVKGDAFRCLVLHHQQSKILKYSVYCDKGKHDVITFEMLITANFAHINCSSQCQSLKS